MLHKIYPSNRLSSCLIAAGVALAFLGVGCEHQGQDQLTQAIVSGERPVAMAGSESFFAGGVVARVTVSRGIGRGEKQARGQSSGGGGGPSASVRELGYQSSQNAKEVRDAYETYGKSQAMSASPLPPVTLHLILINPGAVPVTVHIVDFNSDLGNFVIDPDTLKVPAGETSEPTPMISELGVSADTIPVTVTLKMGSLRETHVVIVKNLLDDNGRPKP
jgi:hypothetical protein